MYIKIFKYYFCRNCVTMRKFLFAFYFLNIILFICFSLFLPFLKMLDTYDFLEYFLKILIVSNDCVLLFFPIFKKVYFDALVQITNNEKMFWHSIKQFQNFPVVFINIYLCDTIFFVHIEHWCCFIKTSENY